MEITDSTLQIDRYRYSQNPAYRTIYQVPIFTCSAQIYRETFPQNIEIVLTQCPNIQSKVLTQCPNIQRIVLTQCPFKSNRYQLPIYQYDTDTGFIPISYSVDPRYAVRKLLGLSTLPYALGADIALVCRYASAKCGSLVHCDVNVAICAWYYRALLEIQRSTQSVDPNQRSTDTDIPIPKYWYWLGEY